MSDATPTPERTGSGPVVLLGDSLVEGGDWAALLDDDGVVNLGVGGDKAEDVEARLEPVVDLDPSVVVLLVGTNDLAARATVEQVVRGNENILFNLHHELPATRLIVCSVLPRERERADYVKQVNIHLRQFAPTVKAEFLDLWPEFAEEDGELKQEYSAGDRVHLSPAAYDAWAERLRPLLE